MIGVSIAGQDGVHRMLQDYTTPKLPKRMQIATKAGGTVFKAPLKAEARKVSKRLARSVSVRTARKDRPATIVTFRPKVAFFRHFVIGGTADHGPKKAKVLIFRGRNGQNVTTRRVKGVNPNPIVTRVFARLERQALDASIRSLTATESK